MLPGQFEAFAYRKAFCERQVGSWFWGLVLWIMKSGGELWLSSIRPEELTGFLSETGWTFLPQTESTGKHGIEYFGVAVR